MKRAEVMAGGSRRDRRPITPVLLRKIKVVWEPDVWFICYIQSVFSNFMFLFLCCYLLVSWGVVCCWRPSLYSMVVLTWGGGHASMGGIKGAYRAPLISPSQTS